MRVQGDDEGAVDVEIPADVAEDDGEDGEGDSEGDGEGDGGGGGGGEEVVANLGAEPDEISTFLIKLARQMSRGALPGSADTEVFQTGTVTSGLNSSQKATLTAKLLTRLESQNWQKTTLNLGEIKAIGAPFSPLSFGGDPTYGSFCDQRLLPRWRRLRWRNTPGCSACRTTRPSRRQSAQIFKTTHLKRAARALSHPRRIPA